MASNDEYLKLRRLTGETEDKTVYSDTDLELALAEAGGDFNLAAAAIWREKAGGYADLVDISEAGSSRKNSALYDRAIAQAERLEAIVNGGGVVDSNASTTRRIVRG